jgi:hypothetical protein
VVDEAGGEVVEAAAGLAEAREFDVGAGVKKKKKKLLISQTLSPFSRISVM